MAIITVSDWLKKETSESFLGRFQINRIYNWIDQSVFRPQESSFKARYRIPEGKSIVLGVSDGWKSKGVKLQGFKELARLLPPEIKIVLIGSLDEQNCIPPEIIHVPHINSSSEMAEAYSMADVFVHLSREDTFGKVIAEAMACGIPAIVFDTTACPEIVGSECGRIVEKGDINGVAKAVMDIVSMGKSEWSEQCINSVSERFNPDHQISKTIKVYKSMVKQ